MRLHATFALLTGLAAATPASALRAEQPLPDLRSVLAQVLHHAEADRRRNAEFEELYRFRLTRIKEDLGSEGQVTRREEKVEAHDPSPSAQDREALAGRGPRPNPQPLKRTDETPPAPEDRRDRPYERKDFSLESELFKRFEFTLVGRQHSNGRTSLMIDFQPATNPPPARDLKERFLNQTAGRVWVDEQDWVLVRAELRLTEPVHVWRGLVGAVHRFQCEFDRDRTAEGYWFIRQLWWRLEGRQLLSRKAIHFREQRDHVRLAGDLPRPPGL